MSSKPHRVVELGVGPGYIAKTILQALKWNGSGELICVDNWHDNNGIEPPVAQELREAGAQIVIDSEERFCRLCEKSYCDILISDADHVNSHNWTADHLRIVRDGGWLFFHDTNNNDFPGLSKITNNIGPLPRWHFKQSSRSDEQCDRGWLVVQKKRPSIAVVMAWNDKMGPLADVVRANHEEYCIRNGHDSFFSTYWESSLSPMWMNWFLARDVLPQYDWVFVLDVDTLFMDFTKPLDGLLGDADFIGTLDINGFNAGAVFVRNTPWANAFLKRAIEAAPRFAHFPSTDQACIGSLLLSEPKEKWLMVPQRRFNSFLYNEYPLDFPEGQYQDGDFLLHLPGMMNERRIEIFKQYLPRVKR